MLKWRRINVPRKADIYACSVVTAKRSAYLLEECLERLRFLYNGKLRAAPTRNFDHCRACQTNSDILPVRFPQPSIERAVSTTRQRQLTPQQSHMQLHGKDNCRIVAAPVDNQLLLWQKTNKFVLHLMNSNCYSSSMSNCSVAAAAARAAAAFWAY